VRHSVEGRWELVVRGSSHVLVRGADGLLVAGVRRRLQRQTLQVATAAQQAPVQRVAALVRLIGQLHAALLADVAVHVEVLVHRDDAHGLVGALDGGDA